MPHAAVNINQRMTPGAGTGGFVRGCVFWATIGRSGCRGDVASPGRTALKSRKNQDYVINARRRATYDRGGCVTALA